MHTLEIGMRLDQLKPGVIARIVSIDDKENIKEKICTKGIFEGEFVCILSRWGSITCKISPNRLFSIGYSIARHIKVIST